MNHTVFLSDLAASLPEVKGAFLFTPQAGILAQHLDDSIGHFNLLGIGRKLTRVATLAAGQLHDLTKIEVILDTMILSGRQLPDQSWLFLIHAPELSGGMIKMALQMALNNSANEIDSPVPLHQPPVAAFVAETPPVVEEVRMTVDTEALMAAGAPLATPLNSLQDALANFIGPAAIPVFHDVLTIWGQEYIPSTGTLKHLVPLVANEIDDNDDKKSFLNHIATLKDLIPQE
jgi:hypothetical protein